MMHPRTPRPHPCPPHRRVAFALLPLLLLSGCRGVPLFNVLGSFFPAWMLCLIVGVVLTLIARWALQRMRFEQELHPLVLVYPALVTFFTCTMWLLLFS